MPSFTFYASAEAIPPTGATPVFCDVDPDTMLRHRRDRARRADAAHEGGDRGRPVRQPGADRRDRGARRAGRRGRRAGGGREARPRAPPARSARSRRSRSSPRRTSAASATAARSRPTTTRSPSAARVLRFHGSRDKVTYERIGWNSRLDELQAAILRVLLPQLDGWCDAAPRGRRALRGRRPRRARRAAGADAGRRRRPGTCTSCATRSADALERGAARRGHRRARLLPHAAAPPGGDRAVGPRRPRRCPSPTRSPRTHLAIPMSPLLDRAAADEVVARRARARRLAQPPPCASGSTSPTPRTCSSCGR